MNLKLLKQPVTFRFKALDYAEAMQLMAKVGINILVGDEVAGAITAELVKFHGTKLLTLC